MQEETTENSNTGNDSDDDSRYRWLPILIAVAIGIPVLIELMTLFNLVKVQFWRVEETDGQDIETVEQVREIMTGDTLHTDSIFVLTLTDARMQVSPGSWKFLLTIGARNGSNSSSTFFNSVQVDSLELNSGRTLPGDESAEWKLEPRGQQDFRKLTNTWEVPNGDIPRMLYLSLQKRVTPDSIQKISRQFHLGPIPVRYHQ